MSDTDTIFELEGATLSLADIAGIDMDTVAEHRGAAFPAGLWDLEVSSASLGEVGKDKKYPVVEFEAKVLNCVSCDVDGTDVGSLLGSTYKETFLIGDLKNFGSIKAMIADSGVSTSGNFAHVLEAWTSTRIRAKIRNVKDKNDPDFIKARIVRNKIKPLSEVTQAA